MICEDFEQRRPLAWLYDSSIVVDPQIGLSNVDVGHLDPLVLDRAILVPDYQLNDEYIPR